AAPGHKRIIEKVAPALKDGQIVVVSPGYWSHLTLPTYLKSIGYEPNLVYAETESLIYACRAVDPGKVSISYVKDELGIGVRPKEESSHVLELMRPFYPQLKDRGNIFQVSLDNVNFPLHPSVLLLNAGWVENTQGNWIFYKEGPSPGIIRVIEGIDAERLALGKAAGLTPTPVYELLKKFYTVPGQKDLLSLLKLNPAYQEIKAPLAINYRYFTEDVPYGLVPISNLSQAFGLSTPVIDSVIQLVSTLLGKDFRKTGYGLAELGLEGISKKELFHRLKEGNGK
ncbi:MAG: NAD/NADP octopine/nopaline dehydrogenase family protein, partial [Methanomicrobia archaeon]|nr:NAD/NADP octopine/nopaline dehydrogenase family protein [Methanomicrobia archaeon]